MHPSTDISLNNRPGYITSSVICRMAGSVRSYSEPSSSEHTGVHMWPAHTQATHWKNEIRE
jgi:hypothetical protein